MKRLLAVLIALLASAADARAAPQLMLPGDAFHGEEVPARDGETWWALVVDAGQARLQSAVVTVKAVEDPLFDGEGETSGRSVTVPGLQPRLLLRGIAALQTGPVPQALDLPQPRALPPNEKLALALGERRWSLSNRCVTLAAEANSDEKRARLDCTLVLDDGSRVQELAPGGSPYIEDGEPPSTQAALLFAGDLDHDGQIDLLLDTSDHENLQRPTLFLSGAAAKGRQVKEVAQRSYTGC